MKIKFKNIKSLTFADLKPGDVFKRQNQHNHPDIYLKNELR